jgi:putative membrane protein
MLLTQAQHERVRAAVEAAEKRTSAEIVCVLAKGSGDYWETALAWAAAVALLVPAVAVLLGVRPDLITPLLGGWTAAQASAVDAAVGQALIAYVIVQGALFVLVALIVSFKPLRVALTPRALKREHVHRRAQEQFAARALHLTADRTGVLIYASLTERRATVIAEDKVAAKLEQKAWDDVVAALIAGMRSRDPGAGFSAAIAKAADHLAGPFPRRADDANELPDTVIELEH